MAFLDQFDKTAPDEKFPLVRAWMQSSPREFFSELRAARPILHTDQATLVALYTDVQEIALNHEVFSVFPYKDKMGSYLMAQDDTPQHWREKAIMQGCLNRDDLPSIRQFVGQTTSEILDRQSGKEMDVIEGLMRTVPIRLVQGYMGYEGADADALGRWSYANQLDTFHNQPFDAHENAAELHQKAQAAMQELGAYAAGLVTVRSKAIAAGDTRDDIVSRLLRTKFPAEINFPMDRLVRNIGGLLIGTVETTAQAAAQALQVLLRRPEVVTQAMKVIDSPAAFDGFVFEALRFDPISPYFFRRCESDYVVGRGKPYETTIKAGATVLPLVLSAMFDSAVFPQPDKFMPTRPTHHTFHFGRGLHECMGKYIGAVMVPEIVRQLLKRPNLRMLGPIEYGSSHFPARWQLAWN